MKREEIRRALAQELLQATLGAQVPTIRDLAQAYGASVGTIQAILAAFTQDGSIELERQGWKGTFLRGKSIQRLWAVIQGGEPLVIALPLPSTPIIEGLASGIKILFGENDITAFLIFLRGSRRRLEVLRRGHCNAAVISAFAFSMMCDAGEESALELPPRTYAREHRVFYYRDPSTMGTRQLKVALDHDSLDLQRLTEMEFADRDVEFVPGTFQQFTAMLTKNVVDAVVWDIDEAKGRLAPTQPSRPLSANVLEQIGWTNTCAALVTRSDDVPSSQIVRQFLDDPRLLEIQREVMAGNRVPAY